MVSPARTAPPADLECGGRGGRSAGAANGGGHRPSRRGPQRAGVPSGAAADGDAPPAGVARPLQPERADPLRRLPGTPAARRYGVSCGGRVAANGGARVLRGGDRGDGRHRRPAGGAGSERQPQRGGGPRRAGPSAARGPAARGARDPAVNRLRGVVHGGHAGTSRGAISISCRARSTEFLCLECVGSPELCVVEGEGMLRMRHYPERARERLAAAGREAGVKLRRGLRTVAATDALIALRAGYQACTLGSGGRDEVPGQLPLAQRRAGEPRLVLGRGRRGGQRGLRAPGAA